MTHPSCSRADSGCPSTCYTADDARGCDRLRPQVFGVRIAETVVIDRLRTSLQARIGSTRDRKDQDPDTKPEALPEKELRADLIAAENAELSRLFEDGTISAATRRRLERSLDLEVTRLADRQR